MLDLRNMYGQGAIARSLVINQIHEKYFHPQHNKFIIDGIRSIHEVELLKTIGIVKTLAIHGSVFTRFQHLKNRSRFDAPSTLEDCINVATAAAVSAELRAGDDVLVMSGSGVASATIRGGEGADT